MTRFITKASAIAKGTPIASAITKGTPIASSVVPIIGSAIGNSRLLGNFVTIDIGGFQSYSIGLII